MNNRPSKAKRPRHRAVERRLCVGGTLLVILWLVALVVLQRWCSEDYLPAFLAVYAPQPPLLLPVVAVMALCLLRLQWRWLALNAALLILGIMLLVPPMLPGRPVPPVDPATRIRIVTWNVHEEFTQTTRVRAAIARLKPDIVCLQESRRKRFNDALPGAQVAHTHEVSTLTRGRIVAKRAFPLGPPPNFRWGLDTDIILPQGRLRVLNVHYMIDVNRQIRHARKAGPATSGGSVQQVRTLENEVVVNWLRSTPGPRVAVGDFNTPPRALIYRQLAAVAADAFATVGRGWGFTFRRDRPVIRIDYVWCAGGVRPLRCAPEDGGLSDHLLLVTDLYVPRGASAASTMPASNSESAQPPSPVGVPEDTR